MCCLCLRCGTYHVSVDLSLENLVQTRWHNTPVKGSCQVYHLLFRCYFSDGTLGWWGIFQTTQRFQCDCHMTHMEVFALGCCSRRRFSMIVNIRISTQNTSIHFFTSLKLTFIFALKNQWLEDDSFPH